MARFKFTFDIQEHYGRVSDREDKYSLELTLLGWRGGKPKYDLRVWADFDDKERRVPLKGVSMTEAEVQELRRILNSLEKSQD